MFKKLVHKLVLKSSSSRFWYAALSSIIALIAGPIFFFRFPLVWLKYHGIYFSGLWSGKKTVIVSLGHPVTFQFLKKLCNHLSKHPDIQLVFSSGSASLKAKEIAQMTGSNFVLPYGILPALGASLYISPKSTVFWHAPLFTKKVHVFHSPVSIHQVYSEGSFQGFDYFFANGPHHKKELTTYFSKRGISKFKVYETGSEIIDRYIEKRKPSKQIKSLIFAPSWGQHSSLRIYGKELIQELIKAGINTILRPHPASVLNDAQIISEIRERWNDNTLFTYDDVSKGGIIDPEVDGMISDWSGVAMEFALGYKKPVFFMDTPQKILNPNWNRYIQEPGIEYSYRDKIGFLVKSPAQLIETIAHINADYGYFSAKAGLYYGDLLYNEGKSDLAAFNAVQDILRLAPH